MAGSLKHGRSLGSGCHLRWRWAWMALLFLPLTGRAEPVAVGMSIAIPPYFIKEIDGGIEYEVIQKSFHRFGYAVTPVFHLAGTKIQAYRSKEVQCISTIAAGSNLPGFLSNPVVTFQNAVITLSKNKIKVNSLDDLRQLNVLGFAGAKKYLGSAYAEAVAKNLHYRERMKNELLPVLLYKGRVNAVVTDVMIFEFYRSKISHRMDVKEPYTIHPLFPAADFGILCHDQKLIDAFNAGLQQVKQPDVYQKIVDKYTKDFSPGDSAVTNR